MRFRIVSTCALLLMCSAPRSAFGDDPKHTAAILSESHPSQGWQTPLLRKPEKPSRYVEIGIAAGMVAYANPEGMSGGLIALADVELHLVRNIAWEFVGGIGGLHRPSNEWAFLSTVMTGPLVNVASRHALGFYLTADLVTIDHEKRPVVADVAFGGELEYLYFFRKKTYLTMSVGAAYMMGHPFESVVRAEDRTSGLQLSFMCGLGMHLYSSRPSSQH
jgi:hypothetical protein